MRYFLELSYKGTPYHGWQKQPNAISVQEVVEDALSVILRNPIHTVGAGRTDTGVHARQLMVHFDEVSLISCDELCYKLNAILPSTIAVQKVYPVHADVHARFDAVRRSYEYHITTVKDPFLIENAYYVKQSLDLEAMNAAAAVLLEYRNFKCFSKSKTDVKTYDCDITEAIWTKEASKLVFTITANRFLRNMVRAIVGTLITVGEGKQDVTDVVSIIKSQDRGNAGYSVPAHGLYLTSVGYPRTIYGKE